MRTSGRLTVYRRSLVTAALLAFALVAAACTSSPGTPSPGSTGNSGGAGSSGAPASPASSGSPGLPDLKSLAWHACTSQSSGPGLKCATLRVPADYTHPNGRKISLALSVLPATAPASKRQGIMLVNPGGPGASGLTLPTDVAQSLNPAVAAEYDIVGFDPRGVGSSTPALHCDPSFFHGVRADYIPSGPAAETALVNRARGYAADCEKRYGWLLPHMTTQNSARDMDAIRQALGTRQLSYFGFSYGTYLGQVYGTLFPGRVHRMVLDSTVDPDGVWWSDNIDQDYAFQNRLNGFFAWAAKYASSYHLGATAAAVRGSWYKAREKLKAKPAAGRDGQPAMGADEFDDTFLYAGYSNVLWPTLAGALSGYLGSGGSDASGLIDSWQLNGAQDENEFAVYNAVQCSDVDWPRGWAYWNSATAKVYKTAPFQAWDNAWYNAACAFWPVKGPARPLQITGQGLPPILMLQGTKDAATPYAGAQDAHRHLPSARMVVLEGDGNHAEIPMPSCAEGYADAYLSSGAVPGRSGLVNATCPAVPDPSPGG
ncbi:MAG: alpha/beta fold hydrolase [Nocardiopsaceae bacterium]|nr:alpha/beta fold hydrolase [Nocardiopsaceae bacterium]